MFIAPYNVVIGRYKDILLEVFINAFVNYP